jgi:glycosyltransferase involved in cell wall biosynthesis
VERGRARDAAARWMEAEAEAFARQAGQWLPRFDARFAASLNEANSLSARGGGVAVIPNVAPTAAGRARGRRAAGPLTIVFVGSLGYEPNADGVLWFAARVWPRLRWALSRRVRFVVVGSNPPAAIAALDGRNGIVVTGTVERVAPFYALADLAVIPVRGGGGARIKLIEAASFAVPIVSTRFGAQGTSFRHGSELLLADDATSFLMGCLALLTDRARAARLASHARQRTRRAYGEERLLLHMEHFLSSLLMRSTQGQLSEPRA